MYCMEKTRTSIYDYIYGFYLALMLSQMCYVGSKYPSTILFRGRFIEDASTPALHKLLRAPGGNKFAYPKRQH